MTLHVLQSLHRLDACIATVQADDFILLIGPAASSALSLHAVAKQIHCGVGVLLDDLDERTPTEQPVGMAFIPVSDDDWVTLTEHHSNQVSWG